MLSPEAGTVYLVGAGPGDPDLLTVCAARLIGKASCILHDDLVSEEILSLAASEAKVCNVGKRCGRKYVQQQEIHRMMIEHARAGHSVVRLKGGDPMVYGRAGEEMRALRDAGISFKVIPGVTAASAAAAAAGISLTDRRGASRVLFTTGHHATADRNAGHAYTPGTALVRYMPGRNYAGIRDELMQFGWPAETICAIISRVGRAGQQTCRATLGELGSVEPLPAPCILLVLQPAKRD